MIKRMRYVFIFLFLVTISCTSFPQSIALLAGHGLFPSDYISLRYSHFTNSEVNLCGGVNMETSRKSGLHYKVYGLDLLAQYEFGKDENINSFLNGKASMGITGLLENEPWVYNRLSLKQRLNYGLVAELEGEWILSESFGLLLFAQQKFLFNKNLGNTSFVFGLGLKVQLNNF